MWNNLTDKYSGIPTDDQLREWCNLNTLNYKAWHEMLYGLHESIRISERMGLKVEVGPFSIENVINSIRPLLAEIYKERMLTLIDLDIYRDKLNQEYLLDHQESINLLSLYPSPQLIPLVVQTIETSTLPIRVVTCGLDYGPPQMPIISEGVNRLTGETVHGLKDERDNVGIAEQTDELT